MSEAGVRVKLCGTTSAEDARIAERFGADYVGVVVEEPASPRSRSLAQAAAIGRAVAVPLALLVRGGEATWVADAVRATGARAVQLLGDESPEYVAGLCDMVGVAEVWKALYRPPRGVLGAPAPDEVLRQMTEYVRAGTAKFVLDTAAAVQGRRRLGGTGLPHDWAVAQQIVARAPAPTWLAGGISPENVVEACRAVRPYGVDLCSGVECRRGKRDPAKTATLFAALRAL
jgi:phosphoribosylanthranilate isomerase